MVKSGQWVRVHSTILPKGARAPGIPEDTAGVHFEMWVKGWLVHDAEMGEAATVRTVAGRTVQGVLDAVEPSYALSYGHYIPEVAAIGAQARAILFGGEDDA